MIVLVIILGVYVIEDADIFLMNADGSGVVQLTRNDVPDSTPVFTPDGRHVVFASERDGNLRVSAHAYNTLEDIDVVLAALRDNRALLA